LLTACDQNNVIKDKHNGNPGILDDLLTLERAEKIGKYHDIKTANEDHEGITTLTDLGDEAYFHTDSENFYFIMVRKGVIVFNMKVNKITSLTSRDEFNNVAQVITDSF